MSLSKEWQLWEAATKGNLQIVEELGEDPAVNVNWRDEDKGRTPFFRACAFGHLPVVTYLLGHPRVDPNLANLNEATPLLIACQEGHLAVVSLLLGDPRVDPNKFRSDGATPFFKACGSGHQAVVSLLLSDPRVDPNRTEDDNSTPLWFASQEGQLPVVQVILASGREIDTESRSAHNGTTAAEHARRQPSVGLQEDETEADVQRRKTNGPLIADLIDAYDGDPAGVRRRLRCLPGIRDLFIGHLFALMVFFSDGFLCLPRSPPPNETGRFFTICSRLPLELQMIISNRIFDSVKDVILSRDSEAGFRWVARS